MTACEDDRVSTVHQVGVLVPKGAHAPIRRTMTADGEILDILIDETVGLPLSVAGFWLRLRCFLLRAATPGTLIATMDEVAAMGACSLEDAGLALDSLGRRGVVALMITTGSQIDHKMITNGSQDDHSQLFTIEHTPTKKAAQRRCALTQAMRDIRSSKRNHKLITNVSQAPETTATIPQSPSSSEDLTLQSESEDRNTPMRAREPKSKSKSKAPTMSFTGTTITGMDDEDLGRWTAAYPAVNIRSQLARAAEWIIANPRRRPRKIRRFAVNWFAREQEAAADQTRNPATKATRRPADDLDNKDYSSGTI